MKKFLLMLVVGVITVFAVKQARACGHEGFYLGPGYTQLIQVSPDHPQTAPNVTSSQRIRWRTRWGTYFKIGYDYCASRWGFEIPVGYDKQRLNDLEIVDQISTDVNAIYHIAETIDGADFYWILGGGVNVLLEGPIEDDTSAAGLNLNFGPGFQYFFRPKFALGISMPLKYTLYFGQNLSGDKVTSVIGVPFRLGFTIGF